MCHTVCARIVSREDPFVVWSLKHLERMALATVWSVGRMGPEEKVIASRDGGRKGTTRQCGEEGVDLGTLRRRTNALGVHSG